MYDVVVKKVHDEFIVIFCRWKELSPQYIAVPWKSDWRYLHAGGHRRMWCITVYER